MRACSLPHAPPRASPCRAPLGRSSRAAPSASAAPLACARLAPLLPPRLALAPRRRRATASSVAAAAASGATKAAATPPPRGATGLGFQGVHHVAVICANLEASLDFYCGTLGLPINPDRPEKNLPYRGAWLWVGAEMIHLMEVPNPDPTELAARPTHGGRDRHACFGVVSCDALVAALEKASVPFTRSASGRAALFFRDPDGNTLECAEHPPWRPT